MTGKPPAILRLLEKIKDAAQLPSLRFVEPDAPYAISVSPTTYPVVTLIKLYDRMVGALGYREIYGQEIAAVFCFQVLPTWVSADQKSLDKFASWAADYLKAVDIALRLEQVGLRYAETLSKAHGFRPLSATAPSNTVIYLNPIHNAFDEVPNGGYFSVVGYGEPAVHIYRRVTSPNHPYGKELIGTIKVGDPLPEWLKVLAVELYLRG
jgi:hypothetical protein